MVPRGGPTPTATTSPSRPATACGARTCATSTATARSPTGDGVDPNRNFARELELRRRGLLVGSRPCETYRGSGPASERETQAHGRAPRSGSSSSSRSTTTPPPSCCCTPLGWQVETPRRPTTRSSSPSRAPTTTPRSTARRAPGRHPTTTTPTSRPELYTTNGEDERQRATAQLQGRSAETPEMDVSDPKTAAAAESVFEFQDSAERPCRTRSIKNKPFALDVEPSRPRTRPTRWSGWASDVPDFVPATLRRSPTATRRASTRSTPSASSARSRVRYQINGGATKSATTRPSGRAASASAGGASTSTACAVRSLGRQGRRHGQGLVRVAEGGQALGPRSRTS